MNIDKSRRDIPSAGIDAAAAGQIFADCGNTPVFDSQVCLHNPIGQD
jgi:hypothetical protein